MHHRTVVAIAAMLLILMCVGFARAAPSTLPGVPLIESERYAEAAAHLEAALRQNPHDTTAISGMIKLELARGNNQAAVDWAHKAVALAPTDAECHLLLGYAYSRRAHDVGLFRKIGIARKILAAFRKGVELAPNDADAHADLASFYIHAPGIVGGSVAKAKQQIALLQPLDPVRANALRAEIADEHGRTAEAERYMRAAAVGDASGNGDYYLGMFLAAKHRYAEARAAFNDGIRANPANSRNYYQAGRMAALDKTDVQAGISDLQQYLAMPHRWQPDTPSYNWARVQLGNLYVLAGDPDAAKAQFREALASDPDFAPANSALDAM